MVEQPIYRAHRAVVFAIAQLSCLLYYITFVMKFRWICKLEGGQVPTCPLAGDATVLEHKSGSRPISETRKDRGSYMDGLYRNSPTLFRTVPFPTPYALPFPRLEVRNPRPKLQSPLSQEQVKLRNSNLASTEGPPEQKPIKNFRETGAWACPGTAQIFQGTPIISGMGHS